MTTNARLVLEDCRCALELLEAETDLRKWRVHWAGALALIRAVGHVLDKVDAASDPQMKAITRSAFKEWKGNSEGHQIFRDFIERERNSILKEYQFNLHPLDEVDVAVRIKLQSADGGETLYQDHIFPIGDNIYRPLVDSYREGDDARDVYSEAIDWWTNELDKIDERISRST